MRIMGLLFRSFYVLPALLLASLSSARLAPLQQDHLRHRHDAVAVEKRQPQYPHPLPYQNAHHYPTTGAHVYTYITPSPGVTPVAVTREGQVVKSYVPQFTLCELPPVGDGPASAHPSFGTSSKLFQNDSASIAGDYGPCTTIYSPTLTKVCATTLTALDQRYTVSKCDQDLTFSTRLGYDLVTPSPTVPSNATSNSTASITPAPSVMTVTTYYLARWRELTAGTAPSEVDLKICRTLADGTIECVLESEVWETSVVTSTTSSVTSINISTTIHGSSQLIVETLVANITELITTFSLSTTLELEYQTQFTSTNTVNKSATSTAAPMSTGPTVTKTRTVEQASGAPTASPSTLNASQNGTSTTTIHITSTVVKEGTTTITLGEETTPASTAPSSTAG